MKRLKSYIGARALGAMVLVGSALLLHSCGTTARSTASVGMDDLYGVHNKTAIAQREARQAEAERAQAEAREARLRAMIADAKADRAQYEYDNRNSGNPYQDLLADDYESAYERRLRGFDSPTYRMPSSYYDFRYGDSYNYATAYDPAFYNIMVMGNQVWVEPKYITAMFGSWGSPSVNFSFGWGTPYWSAYAGSYWAWRNVAWGNPYWGWGPRWSWGWNSPYWGWSPGWSWGWDYPYWGWGGHWHGSGYYRNPNINYRPSYQHYGNRHDRTPAYRKPYGYNNSNGNYNRRGATSSYRNRYDTSPSYRNDNSSTRSETYRPSTPSYNSGWGGGGSSSSGGGGSYSTGGSRGSSGGRGR